MGRGRAARARAGIELDHVVLEVRDPVASAEFYRELLGCAPVRLREFEAGEAPFVSVRLGPGSLLDLFPPRMWRARRPANPNHFCLTLAPEALRAARRGLARRGLPLTRVSSHNFGARGYARSIYFDDPDGISVELRCY
jgi:catechol 2,3-dioxygenase-like lactoylglutathione lyase family enzyme